MPESAPEPSGHSSAREKAASKRAASRRSISTYARHQWPNVTGSARFMCVYPGIGVAASASARLASARARERAAAAPSARASLT